MKLSNLSMDVGLWRSKVKCVNVNQYWRVNRCIWVTGIVCGRSDRPCEMELTHGLATIRLSTGEDAIRKRWRWSPTCGKWQCNLFYIPLLKLCMLKVIIPFCVKRIWHHLQAFRQGCVMQVVFDAWKISFIRSSCQYLCQSRKDGEGRTYHFCKSWCASGC